ncbi:uncharacterized protein LOC117174308 [Belonocnema kinseyi]|uniref:uncharacterized protein LOC117174308 n=1 Tax=Belonocnema kinseyi TaxID=2817044 RepID=UPI00143DB498|nr:uncharacterized protein LOC117174308 [Belonocnema kinseyi]
MCWWPDTENKNLVTNLISSKAEVNKDTWRQLAVEFDKYPSTYQSARRRTTDANYQTTDENNLGRGNRTKTPRRPIGENGEEIDAPSHGTDQQSVPEMFKKTLRLLAEIRIDLKDLTTRVTSLDKREETLVQDDMDLIKNLLPLSDPTEVMKFNETLKRKCRIEKIFHKSHSIAFLGCLLAHL